MASSTGSRDPGSEDHCLQNMSYLMIWFCLVLFSYCLTTSLLNHDTDKGMEEFVLHWMTSAYLNDKKMNFLQCFLNDAEFYRKINI